MKYIVVKDVEEQNACSRRVKERRAKVEIPGKKPARCRNAASGIEMPAAASLMAALNREAKITSIA